MSARGNIGFWERCHPNYLPREYSQIKVLVLDIPTGRSRVVSGSYIPSSRQMGYASEFLIKGSWVSPYPMGDGRDLTAWEEGRVAIAWRHQGDNTE